LAAVPFEDQGKVQAAFPHCAWWWHAKTVAACEFRFTVARRRRLALLRSPFGPRGSGI